MSERDVVEDGQTKAQKVFAEAVTAAASEKRRIGVRVVAQIYDPATANYRGWLNSRRVNITATIETGARFMEAFETFMDALMTHGTLGVLQALRTLQSGKPDERDADAVPGPADE